MALEHQITPNATISHLFCHFISTRTLIYTWKKKLLNCINKGIFRNLIHTKIYPVIFTSLHGIYAECITLIQITENLETFIIFITILYFSSSPGKIWTWKIKTNKAKSSCNVLLQNTQTFICPQNAWIGIAMSPCAFFTHMPLP